MTDALAIFRNPPSRLSINEPGYDHNLGRAIEVWLNGYEQKSVLSYDCDAGVVERYAMRGFGEFVREDDDLKREVVGGDVRVRWKRIP